MFSRFLSDLVLLASAGFLLLSGCAAKPQIQTVDEAAPLRELSSAYQQATLKLNRPPKDAEELKTFLPEGKNIASLLNSPSDSQPYVILWGTDPRKGMDLKPLVIGYEKEGRGGKRFVFTAMGVMQMDSATFKAANFPDGHKPT